MLNSLVVSSQKRVGLFACNKDDSAVLFDAANCTLHAGLHGMTVCYHQLEHYIVVSAVFFDFNRLKFFSTVYSQIANLSASAGDKLLQKCKWRRTIFGRKGHKILGTFIHDQ